MPRVISYTPSWLKRPAPGSKVFSDAIPTTKNNSASPVDETPYYGAHRKIAKRGLEVFVAVGNQIRWTELGQLKYAWEEDSEQKIKIKSEGVSSASPFEAETKTTYRTLNVGVPGPIRQISVSPNGVFLVILTSQTVHVAILPNSARFAEQDNTPIRLKTKQVGPTVHVRPKLPVVSALWHPLGVSDKFTACLVTVTSDSAVRLWELDINNAWSFDNPTLAIDLTKLIDGTSSEDDYSPSGFGRNKGFSTDFVDMEAASACFGGSGLEEENGWAGMTLWVAMKTGTMYALCPLLPSQWQVSSTVVPSLSTAIIPKVSTMQLDESVSEDDKKACLQQYDWLSEIDAQNPLLVADGELELFTKEIRARPTSLSAIPRLQGPFRFDADEDDEEDLDLTDIHVIAAKIDTDELLGGEEEFPDLEATAKEGVGATFICVTTSTGLAHIFVDLDGVEGQWLPKTKKAAFTTPVSNPSSLLLLESLALTRPEERIDTCWPTITPDVTSRYAFFVTTPGSAFFVSLQKFASRLETELIAADNSGAANRLQVFCEGSIALREHMFSVSNATITGSDQAVANPPHLSASLVFQDSDVGYFIISSNGLAPYGATLDVRDRSPTDEKAFCSSVSPMKDIRAMAEESVAIAPPPSEFWEPAQALYAEAPFATFIDKHVHPRHRRMLHEEIRLSPATLDLVSTAHSVLTSHFNAIESACVDLFNRVDRLKGELDSQVASIGELGEKVNNLLERAGKGEDGAADTTSNHSGFLDVATGRAVTASGSSLTLARKRIDLRFERAKQRQQDLVDRYELVRKKLGKLGGRELSAKEKAWVEEVDKLRKLAGVEASQDENTGPAELRERFERAKSLSSSLLAQYQSLNLTTETSNSTPSPNPNPSTPSRSKSRSVEPESSTPRHKASLANASLPQAMQQRRIQEALDMVERESAVIQAMERRLERLGLWED